MANNNITIIDRETGTLTCNGLEIRQGMTVEDFRQYRDAVNIHELGNGNAVIRLKNPVCSNGVDGYVKISLANWADGGMEIEIFPEWGKETFAGALDASKQWMLGILEEDDFQYFPNLAQAKFPWGYIVAQYYSNKDYDEYGGNIEIIYSEKP